MADPDPTDDDPLVELARIVSGRSAFEQPRRRSTFADEPATPVRSESDLARDLEAELLNDLHASFAAMGDDDDDQPLTEQTTDDGGYDDAPYGRSAYAGGGSYDQPAPDRYERPSYDRSSYDEPSTYADGGYAEPQPEAAYDEPREPEPYAPEPYDSYAEPRFADEPTLAEPEPPPPPAPAQTFPHMSLRRSRASVVDYVPPRQPARPQPSAEPRAHGLPPATPMEEVRADVAPYLPEPVAPQPYPGGWQQEPELTHAASAERAAEAYDRAAHAYEREARSFEREANTYEREADGEFDATIPSSFVRPANYGGDFDTPRLAPGETQPPRNRRPLLYALVAVLGVVVIAAAGFLFFRETGAGETTPPVIAADDSPVRILPDQSAVQQEAQPGEAVFNQIDPGAANPAETLLPQPDQPVDDVAAAGVAVDPIAALASQNTEIAQAPADGQPRRVRTIVIGPDGQLLSNDAEAVGEDAAAPQDAALADPAAAADAADPVLFAPADDVPPADAPAVNEAAPANLLPQGAVATPPPGFYVQVASVGSEEMARSQFQSLQARARSLLGSRTMVIQEAVIPGRGTFYRIQIGPMSQGDAESLRTSLRNSGVVPDAIIAQH